MGKNNTQTTLTEILVRKDMDTIAYYKAAVLYILSGRDAAIKVVGKDQKPTYEIYEYSEKIKEAVPGTELYLLRLTIQSKVHEAVLDSRNSVPEKVCLIADRIKDYVKL